MHYLKLVAALLLSAMTVVTVYGQTLNTFVDGQPAVASQVNQNFTLLLTEINQLKAQVAALQPKPLTETVVGTWDMISLEHTTFTQLPNSYDVVLRSSGNKSVVVIKADGTFQNTASGIGNQMRFYNTRTPVSLPDNAAGTPPGAIVKSDIYTGNQSIPDNFSDNGTWQLTGSQLTLSIGDYKPVARVSPDGRIMTIYEGDASGISITIGIKR